MGARPRLSADGGRNCRAETPGERKPRRRPLTLFFCWPSGTRSRAFPGVYRPHFHTSQDNHERESPFLSPSHVFTISCLLEPVLPPPGSLPCRQVPDSPWLTLPSHHEPEKFNQLWDPCLDVLKCDPLENTSKARKVGKWQPQKLKVVLSGLILPGFPVCCARASSVSLDR